MLLLINYQSSLKLDIDTESVLKAAGTKWNFLPFRPGLVGGHCIGVDPYYLIHKSKEVSYNPELILAARKINEHMAKYLTSRILDLMAHKKIQSKKANILIMGFSFKENCPDFRNTRIVDVFHNFKKLGCYVDIYDPFVNSSEVKEEYDIKLIDKPQNAKYDVVIIALAHDKFKNYSPESFRDFAKKNHVIFDVKYLLNKKYSDGRF